MANVTKHNRRSVERIDNKFGKYDPDVVARPVDTYVHHRAPDDAGRNYRSLAAALSGISPALNEYLKKKHDEKVKKDEATGERLYYETGGERLSWETFRHLHDERLKETGISTSVRNGYLKARMANEANIFRESINEAYNSGEAKVTLKDGTEIPVSESDDPSIMSLWMNRFTKDYIHMNLGKDVDPEYFSKIFIPQLERTTNELASKHISERNSVIESKNIAAHNTNITDGITKLREPDGYITTDEARRKEILDNISQGIRDMLTSGVGRDKALRSVAQTLVGLALDPTLPYGEDILFLAREIKLEDGTALWDNEGFAREFYHQMEQISQNRRYRERQAKEEEREKKREEQNDAIVELFMLAREGKGIPPELEERFVKMFKEPGALAQLYNQFRMIQRGPYIEEQTEQERDKTNAHGLTKEQVIQGRAYADDILSSIINGGTPDLRQLIKDPRWRWMDRGDQSRIMSMLAPKDASPEGKERDKQMKEAMKEAQGHANTVVSSYLGTMVDSEGNVYNKDHPDYKYFEQGIMSLVNRDLERMYSSGRYVDDPQLMNEEAVMRAREYAQMAKDDPQLFTYMMRNGFHPSDIVGGMDSYITDVEAKIDRGITSGNTKSVDAYNEVLNRLKPKQAKFREQGMISHEERHKRIKEAKQIQAQQIQEREDEKAKKSKEQAAKLQQRQEGKDYDEHMAISGKDFYLKMVGGGKNKGVTGRFTDKRAYRKGQHNGIDIAAPEGTPIQAPHIGADGVWDITEVGKGNKTYGNYIRMTSETMDGKKIEISIGHMQDGSIDHIKVGDRLSSGMLVGRVGSTGVSTGPHMDMKIKVNGKYVDPETYKFS